MHAEVRDNIDRHAESFTLHDIHQEGYVFIVVCLFVSRITQKTAQSIFTKFGGKAAHGPLKKQLDLGGNPDHATLWLG